MKNQFKVIYKAISKQMFFENITHIDKAINKTAYESMNIRLDEGYHYLQFYKHSGTLKFDKRVVEKDPCTMYFSSTLLGETDDDYTIMKLKFSDMITDFIEWTQDPQDIEYAKQVVEGLKKQVQRLEKHIKEIK